MQQTLETQEQGVFNKIDDRSEIVLAQHRIEIDELRNADDETLIEALALTYPDDEWEVYEELLYINARRQLTSSERELLNQLRDEADLMMLRKAYAGSVLHGRGYDVSDPQNPIPKQPLSVDV